MRGKERRAKPRRRRSQRLLVVRPPAMIETPQQGVALICQTPAVPQIDLHLAPKLANRLGCRTLLSRPRLELTQPALRRLIRRARERLQLVRPKTRPPDRPVAVTLKHRRATSRRRASSRP